MKPVYEAEILKESIALMETKLARKFLLAGNESVYKNEEIEKNAKDLMPPALLEFHQ